MAKLKGKTVIVTGATQGIGKCACLLQLCSSSCRWWWPFADIDGIAFREVAQNLAGQGATVVLACRNLEAARSCAGHIRYDHLATYMTPLSECLTHKALLTVYAETNILGQTS